MKAWICVFGLLSVIPVWATHDVDFNFDGKIDLADLFLFADVFGHPVNENNEFFDLNGDGAINFPDFYLFADQYHKELIVDLPGGAKMEFVWIEPGTFMMGSPSVPRFSTREGPQHEVTISRGFYLGKYEITQGEWESVMGTTPWSGQKAAPFLSQGTFQANASHPAAYISWYDMQEFVGELNAASGEEIFRLPTEAEWEYACFAGATTRWSFGDDENQLEDYAWYFENVWYSGNQGSQPVGTKWPNPWGIFDMYGNVAEWCQDWFGDYSSGAQVDPTGPVTGTDRVIRGGHFFVSWEDLATVYRYHKTPDFRYNSTGARLLRTE